MIAALVLAILLVAAAPAGAVTRKQANAKALAALGSQSAGTSVVVFTLPKPVAAGSRVTQEGTNALVAKARARSFFFYQDGAPSQAYPHPGRVVLVTVRGGKAKVSRTFRRRPLVNGKLPAFLRSASAYRSTRYRVLDTAGTAKAPAAEPTPVFSEAPAPLLTAPLSVPNVTPNSPPSADDQNSVIVKQGRPKRITLTGSDDDGDPLVFFITNPPSRGTLTGQPPDVVYTPDAAYLGPDHFTFKSSDGEKDSNAANIKITVVPLGLPPIVMTSSGCTEYVEQGPAVVVDSQLTVADADDLVLDSARVRIASNQQGGDTLLFTDQNGISGSFDDNSGVLNLTGTASVANYQAALSSVRYRNVASGNPPPTKDIEFVVNDAGNDSAPATKQLCITGGNAGGNDRPTGEPSEGGLSYIENDGPVPADGGFVVGDPDSTQLSGATVKFVPFVSQPVDEEGEPVGPPTSTVTFSPAEDELGFTDQNGITGSYDDVTGIMTLSGTASLADYETAIRSVTYENVSEDPTDATRRLQFQVTDDSGSNSVATRRDVFVTPVNDAPEVEASEGTTDYTGSATTVDGSLSAIDVDDDDLESARVAISSGFVSGDELVFTDQSGITGSYDDETGVLTLSGTAPVADYETALRSIAYDHTGGTPTGDRTVEFATNDGELDSAPSSKHVEINDQPVLDASDDTLAYTENDGPVVVDSGLTASDPDSASFTGATVAIASGFADAQDELAFTDQNGISGVYDDTTGVLTLTGSASVADYETALRSVTYENSSDDPSASRTISFQVDDGAVFNNVSATVSRDVAITAVNDAPAVATSEGATAYTEGDPATTVDGAVTVSDVDDASLESAVLRIGAGFEAGDDLVFVDQSGISGIYNTESGTLTLTGTASAADYETALRSVQYSHSGDNPAASKTVEYTVNDGDVDSAVATKELAVTGVNDKPSLDTTDTALDYTEGDGAVAVDPGIAASDPDSSTFAGATVSITTGFDGAQDELAFADQNGIAGVYDDTSGVLTLSGSASVADYETALRSVTYENSSADPSASRTVSFQVDDGGATDNVSDAATRDIAIAAVAATAPVVTTSAGTTTHVRLGPATAIDPALTVTDSDDTNLESAQVRVSSGFEIGDELVFVNQNGITGAYNTATGVLTLLGSATVADYETALRSVAFDYFGENPNGSRVIEFKANDGDQDSAPATKALDITSPPEE
ncbi:MAG TPA: hypothetical protein VF529_09235 [Solirubrobacteraceae bacterium]